MFACEFCGISKKTIFTEHLPATASDQTPPLSLRVASTPYNTKINQHWLNYLTNTTHTHIKSRHLARGRCKWKLSNPWGDKRTSWTHLPFSFHLINTRNKKMKPQVHPASLFRSATTGTKTRTHLLGRWDLNGWLIVWQMSIKAEWRDASLVLWDFSRSNNHCIHLSTKTIYFSRFVFSNSALSPIETVINRQLKRDYV